MTITTANWTNSAGGDWSGAGNWTPAAIPGVNNNVVFGALSPYVVTITAAESANSVAINFAGATLSITASSLTDTTTFSNSGTFNVDATGVGGSIVTAGGALTNSGLMQVGNSSTQTTATSVTALSVNNTVGGTLNIIGGSGAGATSTVTASKGNITNAGTISIGNHGTLAATAGAFTQTAGSTTVASGGALTAKSFSVTGGSLTFNNSLTTLGQTYSVTGGAGASITFGSLTNMPSTTLTGGTFTVGTLSTLNLPHNLVELDATLTMVGSTSEVANGSTTIEQSLSAIGVAAAGTLNVTAGKTFTASNSLTVGNGSLLYVDSTSTLNGTAVSVTVNSGGNLKDGGKVSDTVTVNAGGKMTLLPSYVAASTGTVTGAIGVGGATLELAAGAVAGAVTLGVSGAAFNGFSTVKVDSAANWTVTTPTAELATTAFSALGATDVLTFTDSSASLSLDGVIGFPTINLAAAGGNGVTVTTNTLSKSAVTINDGGGSANAITSTNTVAGKTLTYVAGTQAGDVFTGDKENDTVKVAGANVGGDTFTGGTGANTLTMTSAGGLTLVDLSHVSNFATIGLSASGTNSVKVTNGTLTKAVTINAGAGPTAIDASGVVAGTPGALTFNAGAGADTFTGGIEADIVKVSAAATAGDTLNGGGGTNTLTLTSSGNVDLTHVSKFQTITLGGAGANTVTIGSTTLSTSTTTINDATGGTTLTSSGTSGQKLTFNSVGTDSFTGGAEDDTVRVTAAKTLVDTTLAGGLGADTLNLSTGGAVDLSKVTGFETINLAGGSNTVTVTANTLSGGGVILNGNLGSKSTINAGTASGSNTLTYNAGFGDTFTGGTEADIVNATAVGVSADTLNGGTGASNTLNITTAGTFDITKDTNFGTYTLAAGTNVVTATTGEITGSTLSANSKSPIINNNTLKFSTAGSVNLGNVSGINTVTLAGTTLGSSLVSGVSGGMTINDAATLNSGTIGNSVSVASGATGAVTYVTTTGHDTFQGGVNENDTVKISSANIATAHLTGSTGGNNTLALTDAGFFSLPLANVSFFGTVNLAAGNSNVAVADTAFVGGALAINDSLSGGNNLINATAITGGTDNTLTLNFNAGPGTDLFVGGKEIDNVKASAAAVSHDTLMGGSNPLNALTVSSTGTFSLNGVSNFHNITLAAGNSTVTVTNTTLFGGAVTLNDGASGNNNVTSLGASGVGALTYVAGVGADTFNAGGESDNFVFTSTAAGLATINAFDPTADALGFHTTGTNAFGNIGFASGTTATFTVSQDLFYNTNNGQLLYSANSGVSSKEIAVFGNHASLTAANLFAV